MLSRRLRIILAVLLVASLTFVILDLRAGRGPMSSARDAGAAVFGGLERGFATVVSPIFAVGDWWGTWGDQRQRIADLETENQLLQQLVRRGDVDRARAAELDALLKVASVGQYRVVPAEIIAVGPEQDYAWTVTIDAGSGDGIQPDMTVINGDGLVGRVQSVGSGTSTVVLLVDASSAVGARVAGTEEIGILSGIGRQDSLEFQLLDPLAPLQKGDALVTFGSKGGRPYAPGLPIGEVISITGTAGELSRTATVRPYADVSTLGVVGVVTRPPRTDPRDSVLPTPPAAGPSPSPSPQPSSPASPSASPAG